MNEQPSVRCSATGKQSAFGRRKFNLFRLFAVGLMVIGYGVSAQTYTPLAVTGFTQDVVAETGASSLAVTSTAIDGANHVIYSKSFATANGLAGGLPDNGTVISGTRTYQMQPYTGNNAIYVSSYYATVPNAAGSSTLTLTTPAVLSRVSALLFSTEGGNYMTATINFSDGTTYTTALTYISDWFNGPAPVLSGHGRIYRLASGPYTPDGPTTNPRLYYWDIAVPCTGQSKSIKSVTYTSLSSDGYTARAVILALSGVATTPVVIAPTIIPAHCNANNGAISLSVAGGSSPYTYLWNTTPAQTNVVVANLGPGTYTCTVTDANSCKYTYSGTVVSVKQDTLVASAIPTRICAGDNTTIAVTSAVTTPATYTWTPGGATGSAIIVAPVASTTYTVTSKDFYGCTATDTALVTVSPIPTASFSATPQPACVNAPETIVFTGTAGSTASYDWNGFAGATVRSGSGAGPYSIQYSQPGTYNVQLKVTDNGCVSPVFASTLSILGPGKAPVVTLVSETANSATFSWTTVPGALSYQVSINGGPYATPSSGPTGTTHTVTGLAPLQSISLSVIALGPESCQNSAAGTSSARTLSDPVYIPNSFSPNGDGKNDVFKIYSNLVTSMEMRIFNQWGELLFETTQLNDGWNGQAKGKNQPVGVYIYTIRVKLTDGTESVRKGALNLLH